MPESALQKIVYFNPRSLVGNDCAGCNHCNHFFISIHVPSWGTTINVRAVVHHDVFQSTFPRGERPLSGSASLRSVYFNPRSLVGNDREPFFEGVLLHYFNPRSLVGNDDIYKGLHPLVRISIHVPSWGTTQILLAHMQIPLFQSTFPRGERLHVLFLSIQKGNFNPRSLVGNDIFSCFFFIQKYYFNPRSLVGNDGKFSQIFFVFLCNKYNFSTFYYPFSLFFSVIHVTFLIFVVRILPAFYVYF